MHNYCIYMYMYMYMYMPLRLLYSLIIYEIVIFSFFTLYSLLLLSFFLYLKSVPIYVIVHVYALPPIALDSAQPDELPWWLSW